ncbi:hypothetical protein IGI04_036396 [Brassica rapa subsp. trilocularis]|uniref:Uncharacterized protein n=1 Tax=Brassica rapa subsp. trilocularis TaxID=1813537 RepID=A0ABQ7LGM4_BRACM|nr:hypothetical protein IGI04_036396 [Brassica rapa subsp. trilocularis]
MAVRGCPSAHTERRWLSSSTHISMLVLGLSTLTLPVDCSGDFRPRGLSVQYTQDVRGYPCESVCVRMCPSAHTGRPWLSISTHIRTLVLGLSTLALPVDCLRDFGPRGLTHRTSVGVRQHIQDVLVCPPAHKAHLWLSVAVRGRPSAHRGRLWLCVCRCVSVGVGQHTQDVCGCPWLSVSTHRTSVCVCQHTQDIHGYPSAHIGRLWLSVSTHISTLVHGLSTLALPMDCLGDFGPRGLSAQYTQDVCGCPPRPWLSISTHRTSVDVCVCLSVSISTQDVCGCPSVHISARWSLDSARWPFPWTVWVILAHVGCLSSTHRTSMGVRHGRGCLSAHTGRLWLSVCVRQHTHDVRGCPEVQYQHDSPWTQHADPSRGLFV